MQLLTALMDQRLRCLPECWRRVYTYVIIIAMLGLIHPFIILHSTICFYFRVVLLFLLSEEIQSVWCPRFQIIILDAAFLNIWWASVHVSIIAISINQYTFSKTGCVSAGQLVTSKLQLQFQMNITFLWEINYSINQEWYETELKLSRT